MIETQEVSAQEIIAECMANGGPGITAADVWVEVLSTIDMPDVEMTFAEIAELLEISPQRAHQIYDKGLRKMREAASPKPPAAPTAGVTRVKQARGGVHYGVFAPAVA